MKKRITKKKKNSKHLLNNNITNNDKNSSCGIHGRARVITLGVGGGGGCEYHLPVLPRVIVISPVNAGLNLKMQAK